MDAPILNTLCGLDRGKLKTHGHMAVIPLRAPDNKGPGYLTLGEAQQKRFLNVTEVNHAGKVPELKVHNNGDERVLILDGEELAGAKQNRVINTTILIRRRSSCVIPVSCTEQGRWDLERPDFEESGVVMPPRMRHAKTAAVTESLHNCCTYVGDQGEVWDQINDLSALAGVDAPTGAMRDVFDQRKGQLAEYERRFAVEQGQTGLLVMIDGKVAGMDILSSSRAFAVIAPKLIRSYAMDALLARSARYERPKTRTANLFIGAAIRSAAKAYKSVGHGIDWRFEGRAIVGSALVYRNCVIHLAFFPSEERAAWDAMRGPGDRQRFRR